MSTLPLVLVTDDEPRITRLVSIILLTAKGSTSDKAKGIDLGADDYVAKPFHPEELAARVVPSDTLP